MEMKNRMRYGNKDDPSAWHRVGWTARQQHRSDDPDNSKAPMPACTPGPTVDHAPRTYHGPVYIRPLEHTFLHTRMLQHTHRTVLMQSTAPKRDTNYGALFTELDVRLHNMHNTLAAVRDRSASAVAQEQQQQEATLSDWQLGPEAVPPAGALPADDADTMQLRQSVNQNLVTQMDFFTQCMARWCLQHCECKCIGCECICRQTAHTLAGHVYGAHNS
mmetsp:Transcript_4877/g.10474  ORF Transcript_4877/g.10474 Transcript_4877/m.10474 type:complete len:218 (-) Transcript_4877:725-1378(-)